MKKLKNVMKLIVDILILIVVAFMAASLAYWIKSQYQGRPSTFSEYVEYISFFGLGTFLLIITSILINLLIRKREIRKINNIIDAMKRVSKGDFSVRLDTEQYEEGYEKVVATINEMVSELGTMETMRQEFISSVSHEIQSPLTSIGGFARALLQEEEVSPQTRRHYLGIIESESQRLSKLSDNLLKLTALESTEPLFEKKQYRLDKQIRRVVLSAETQWSGKDLNIELELEETMIKAEEDLMSQVWINLLHNSIKFTAPGGWIKISMRKSGSQVEVLVADNGIGIANEDMTHIFERFYKADKSRNREAGGSGLGLSLVKKIIDLHGGEITAASVLGEGTTFKVILNK
ncbi:HAMP domain-containing sensor histidine kinase [Paenibacillus sp. YPG26]|uniref:sensor histidine kinase n=1 Tax=Paenibacillus sp. YPG26 TaxID=2878915 RepID=UPI00203C39C4|nr:HAMP domain-containing sensor histidine kinase [Paenibacillus sp. YPG26]USB31962.1 HAMP domain-containing histidine kinase [Paenibacillus sp. YPG26]